MTAFKVIGVVLIIIVLIFIGYGSLKVALDKNTEPMERAFCIALSTLCLIGLIVIWM